MPEKGYLYRSCRNCGGTGEVVVSVLVGENESVESHECPVCTGSGILAFAGLSDNLVTLFDDMNDKINDIMDKCNDILEKVNA
jgi:hypothetical protein